PRVASQFAVFSASSARMDTAQAPAASTASWKRAIFSAQNSTSGGSSETEANALTVMAWPALVVTTTMPPGNWPAACREAACSTALTGEFPLAPPGPADPADERRDHRGGHAERAAVQVPLARRGGGDDDAAIGDRHG